jgi:hypothetical protein
MHGIFKISDFLPFGLLLIIAIRFFDNLNGMEYPIASELIELHPAAEAICDEDFWVHALYFCYQPACDLNGQLMEFLFKAHDACIAAAVVSVDRI